MKRKRNEGKIKATKHLPVGLDPAHGKNVSATVVEQELVRLLLAFASQLTKQAHPIEIKVFGDGLADCLQQGRHEVHLGARHAEFRARNNATRRPSDPNIILRR